MIDTAFKKKNGAVETARGFSDQDLAVTYVHQTTLGHASSSVVSFSWSIRVTLDQKCTQHQNPELIGRSHCRVANRETKCSSNCTSLTPSSCAEQGDNWITRTIQFVESSRRNTQESIARCSIVIIHHHTYPIKLFLIFVKPPPPLIQLQSNEHETVLHKLLNYVKIDYY